MSESPEITIAAIAKVLNIGRDTINEHIANLKRDGVLKRVGGRKFGHWVILKNGDK